MAKVLQVINGIPTITTVQDTLPTIYSVITTGNVVTASTPITLPSSRTYNSTELAVYRNGRRLQIVTDYNYVGSNPRTQITLTQDLAAADELLYEITRAF